VDADTYLLELAAYIHLNPVRAGMAERPDLYSWSSHRAYLGHETIPWLSPDCVLTRFSANLEQARRLFDEFVAERVEEGHREEFYGKGSLDGRLIGEDRFVEKVLCEVNSLPVFRPSMEAVLEVVTRMYNLLEEDLSASGQKRMPSEARGLAAWAVRELTDATLNDLAEKFGRDASTSSAAISRFEVRQKGDPALAGKVERLIRELKVAVLQA
jgi:hypothetical protein